MANRSEPAGTSRLTLFRWSLAGLTVMFGITLLVIRPGQLTAAEVPAAALTVAAIGFWATGVIPEHLTALWFFLLAMLLSVAPAAQVFSGFTSAALWLVFAGLIVGVAVDRTGLGARVARRIAERFTRRYLTLLGGLVAVGVVLGFLMPSSMGRVVLFIPIALAVAEHAGFAPGSNGRTGVVLAAAFGAHVPTFAILPANVPNMVLVGSAETQWHVSPLYGEYLLLHFPVLGLLKAVLLVVLIAWLYPDTPRGDRPETPRTPLSNAERKLSWILLVALALWMTDFLHHISPAWVALAAALLLLLPRFGIVSAPQFRQDVNYNSLFFVAGIMGLGAVVTYSGLGAHFAKLLGTIAPLAHGHDIHNFASLTVISLLTGLVTTLPGVPAVLTPLAGKLAAASGLPLKTVLMTQVLGFSTTIFPYESAPLVVAMQLAGESLLPAMRLALALALVTVVLLFPLDFLWWRFLGWI